MSTWDRFRWVIENRHQYARKWKESTGGKVVGWLCTYVPEEMVHAAGMLPVRIVGSHEPQDVTEPYIFSMFCSYSRDCLAQGLQGRYDYLDGVVAAHGCYHIRQTFYSWKRHVSVPYSYEFFMPTNSQSPGARRFLPKVLDRFQLTLRELTGVTITPEALRNSVEIYNTNRRLMREIYELRKAETPPLSGVEALEMVKASMLMDKEEHNQLLREALEELRTRGAGGMPKVRLMMVGSEVDEIPLLELIESLGAQVVIDDNCFGTRYFWSDIVLDGDLLGAIARRYLDKPPCPVYDVSERRRLPHLEALARDYRVQGAILVQLKFCDAHQYDLPAIRRLLQGLGVPTLTLECDITVPTGQLRTRIEAFLEMLQAEVS